MWANTIATVLVALSAGYWVGGRLADRDPTLHGLCRLVLAASVLLAVVPFVAGPFLGGAVDALDAVEAGAFVGSLIGRTLGFYGSGQGAGIIMSVVGAIILLWIYRMIVARRATP